MPMWSSTDVRSRAGRRILERIFRNAPFGFAARLWDGTRIPLWRGEGPFTLVFRSPAVFRRLVLRPNTMEFAQAYVRGDLDVEGDLLAAVGLANGIDRLRLGVRERLAILLDLLRL
jgi:cyclopropane-fatty-acyl-phospholipid synthase